MDSNQAHNANTGYETKDRSKKNKKKGKEYE